MSRLLSVRCDSVLGLSQPLAGFNSILTYSFHRLPGSINQQLAAQRLQEAPKRASSCAGFSAYALALGGPEPVLEIAIPRTPGRNASPQDLESARLNFLRLKPEMTKQGIALYKTRISQA